MCFIGLDIGSVSVKAVLTKAGGTIDEAHYRRHFGQPVETTLRVLSEILARTPPQQVAGLAATGSGGALIAQLLGCFFVNELIAQGMATGRMHPDVRTVIEIGGEDSKLILLAPQEGAGRMKDFAMNTVCAAGTGSFLDQQAARLGIDIEEQFGCLALKSTHPPRIAGRCSVFAKSDMIHLQQAATPEHDILMGLCLALARTFRSTVARNLDLELPIAFHGGVAANAGMVRAFEMVLNLSPGQLMVPRFFAHMGCIGAVLAMQSQGASGAPVRPELLEAYLRSGTVKTARHAPLVDDGYRLCVDPEPVVAETPVDAYLGIDVGSISTNLVVMDSRRRVIARRYLMTAGRPIQAVQQGLFEIGQEIGDRTIIRGAATTGSGRYLIGDFIGADFVKNEITAHARGAVSINPQVDTIFEIGGQDSKYIRLKNGAVVDFTMNKVCAAGTGSFLEEQAEKLGIDIKDEFGRRALASPAPAGLGERCTVFMESSLNRQQQLGLAKDDLVAGLCYSIVLNYLSRVVEDRPVGNVIFFQGGTAYNRGVKAAFEQVCGKKIIVPPHHDVLGALGAALIAAEQQPPGQPSRFRGFDLARRSYMVDTFACPDCPNSCEIRTVTIEGEKPLYYGSRCGKFDEEKRGGPVRALPDLFRERERLLLEPYKPSRPVSERAPCIGIPRATHFFELYPFWQAFFAELGCRLQPSAPTTRAIISQGCESVVEDICFPIKVAHGHVVDLLHKQVDFLFLPSIINLDPLHVRAPAAYNCPLVQSLPHLVAASVRLEQFPSRVLKPVIHFEWGPRMYLPQLRRLAADLGCDGAAVAAAAQAGFAALDSFRTRLLRRGAQIMADLPAGVPVVIIVSRSYNGCDDGLNFRIPEKLHDLGALAIPLDFVPLPAEGGAAMDFMYWRSGQRILGAAQTVANDDRLQALYLTNFACGPDSFIMKHFTRTMQGKPFLAIELDEHSADAGLITRLEAFLDSLASAAPRPARPPHCPAARPLAAHNARTLYLPYMDDHGLLVAAAMRRYGVSAPALPMADEATLAPGRRYTSGKECFPFMITTGDIVKKALADDFDPCCAAFFMPSAMGPCRFGQYSRAHRLVLDDLGLPQVPIVELDQTVAYDRCLSRLGSGFRRLGWQAIILVDYLKKLLLQTRPYECNPGDSDQAYQECLSRAMHAIEQHGRLRGCARWSVERFAAVPVKASERRPLVGIVGEIFIRSHQFSNNFFIRRIEKLGAEVAMPTLQEWVQYTDWERRKDLRRSGRYAGMLRESIMAAVQQWYVARIGQPFQGSLARFCKEMNTDAVMRLAASYISEDIRGEAPLSLGRAAEYACHGFAGIANLIPFNCLPGTMVNTILWRFSRDNPNVPVLKMVYDGTVQSGDETRIEAFMYQVHQVFEKTAGE